MSHPLRIFRFLEIVIPATFALIGVAAFFAPRPSVGAGIGFLAFAAFAVLMFELRFWGHRRSVRRVRAELEQVGARDFDAPAEVVQRPSGEMVEELASNPRFARMMARRSTRLAVSGKWRGREIEIGTAIVAGRDFDQMISYALAVDGGVPGPFRVMSKGAITSIARLGMDTAPVTTGDATFDADWVVDADPSLATRVLDDTLRATLIDLRSRLSFMQVASIEATRHGVIVRWPGELTPESGGYLRDLATEVRSRLGR